MTIRVRPFITAGMLTTVFLIAGCSDDGGDADETPSAEQTTVTEPALTAPPTRTPEDEAEAAIKETFKGLIADRDDYYSNASDYSVDEVETSPPALRWRVTFQAEGELSNWTVAWRRASKIEQVGDSVIATHNIINVQVDEAGAHTAQSTACLDMRELEFVTYDGEPAELSYTPDPYQTWKMAWTYHPEVASDAGIDEPGWYVRTIDLTRNQPC